MEIEKLWEQMIMLQSELKRLQKSQHCSLVVQEWNCPFTEKGKDFRREMWYVSYPKGHGLHLAINGKPRKGC